MIHSYYPEDREVYVGGCGCCSHDLEIGEDDKEIEEALNKSIKTIEKVAKSIGIKLEINQRRESNVRKRSDR